MRLGVPQAMLPEVRGIADADGLESIEDRLPEEAHDALFLYLAGDSYEDLVRERETPPTVDVEDFTAALQRPESQMRFAVAADEMKLEAMLNAPLARWRVFLHPSQRRLVERDWNGPLRVLGGAGTGKTVAAMHRARYLVRTLPEGRILFTTFTRNLAADIEHNLGAICTPEEMQRIEVTNLDRWVARYLRGQRYQFQLQFGRLREAWQIALDVRPPALNLPDAFYEDEWEQVVQAGAVADKQTYLAVSRAGRGTRLNRGQRALVWPVFEEYRAQLAERGVKEVDDAYRDATALLAGEASDPAGYAAVIVDEAQDMGAPAFRLLRAIAPPGRNDLFIAGDGHQRIYGRRRVVLGRCGIDIRGRSRKLRAELPHHRANPPLGHGALGRARHRRPRRWRRRQPRHPLPHPWPAARRSPTSTPARNTTRTCWPASASWRRTASRCAALAWRPAPAPNATPPQTRCATAASSAPCSAPAPRTTNNAATPCAWPPCTASKAWSSTMCCSPASTPASCRCGREAKQPTQRPRRTRKPKNAHCSTSPPPAPGRA